MTAPQKTKQTEKTWRARDVGSSGKQFLGADAMATGRAVKVLLATCPRALLRSTLTARPSAKTLRKELLARGSDVETALKAGNLGKRRARIR